MDYGIAVLAVLAATGVCALMFRFFELSNLVMVYLVSVMLVAMRGKLKPAVCTAILSVLAFDFFFVPPRFTFSVSDAQYLWTFLVMFCVALIISRLTIRLQEEAEAARQGEQRTVWLMEKAKKAEVAAETERLRSALLSSVSHDFRTPLTAILGSTAALLNKEELRHNAGAYPLLENIQTEGDRLLRLVQNLLEATRLETGIQLIKERYPLEEVVGAALERVQPLLAGRAVTTDLPEDLPSVPLDPVLIEQVFINLLENAARHTPAGAAVRIRAVVGDHRVTVTVADGGPGIRPEDRERVFDKFYRRSDSDGSGLGLAICRAIVHAHGGTIAADNAPEGGAIFRFTLPLEDDDGR